MNEPKSFDLKVYLFPLIRWWWILVVSTLLAGVSAFFVIRQQPPAYSTRTTLMVGNVIMNSNPNAGDVYLTQQLASTYADIANRQPVREAAMKALGLADLPDYSAQALPNSQVIEIAVTDSDPQRAQAVANELAHQLILNSPGSASPEDQARQTFVNDQLNRLQAQIKETQDEVQKLQDTLEGLNSAREIADTQAQIQGLQAKEATLRANYADLLANTSRGSTNTLSVIEPAFVPTVPVGPSLALTVLLSAAIGLALSVAGAYLLEYLDDTLRYPFEINRIFQVPVIGKILEAAGEAGKDQVFILKSPRHPVAENFRQLRTNLNFVSVDRPVQSLLVTSAEASDGKTFVAANLAAAMAFDGKKVVVLDADLRRPAIHKTFNLPNRTGLSEVLIGEASPASALVPLNNDSILVMTSGPIPPNPAELLASSRMKNLLVELKELCDVVIIDGPPFIVTDASILAAGVDGVLAVVRLAHTRRSAAKAMMEQVRLSGARLVGICLNRIPPWGSSYGYQTSYYYGHPDDKPEVNSKPAQTNSLSLPPDPFDPLTLLRNPKAKR